MTDDDKIMEEFVIDSLRRALTHGSEAFARLMKKEEEFLPQALAKCAAVYALWPDASSKAGFMLMPIKRELPPDAEHVVGEVLPVPTRAAAFALLDRFGDETLRAEFEPIRKDGLIPPLN
jgi:hypothetical protein